MSLPIFIRRFFSTVLRGVSSYYRLAGPVILLLVWHIAAVAGWFDARVLPGPVAVITALGTSVSDGTLLPAVLVSLTRLLAGFLLGSALGVLLGLISGLWQAGEDLLDGTLQALRAIPFLALAPLFGLWFVSDELAKVALVAFGSLFPLYLNTISGIRAVDVRLVESASVVGLSSVERIREVILPGALPSIFVGLRIGFSWALAALVSSELANASAGIGALVAQAREFVQTDMIFVCVVTYALIGLFADNVLRLIEWRVMPWRQTFTGR
jgi:sulfonate transport system permease protein